MVDGPEFYDEADVFTTYQAHRERPTNPNITIEAPILWEMLGDVTGLRVLDLGCEAGEFGEELLQKGCESYIGIEASDKMVSLAQARFAGQPKAKIHRARLQDWIYPQNTFDLVTSRLVLHYIDDLKTIFEEIYASLKTEGHFIISVEHPVLTSCNRSMEQGGYRQDWIVDDYFSTGRRDVAWLGGTVIKYHRTVEDYFSLLQSTGFMIDQLRESRPQPDNFDDMELLQRRMRILLFLFFLARKYD